MLDAWSRHHSIHVRIRMPTNIHTQAVCVFTCTYAIFVRTYSHILTNSVFGQYYQTRYCLLATLATCEGTSASDRVNLGGGLFKWHIVSTTCVSGSFSLAFSVRLRLPPLRLCRTIFRSPFLLLFTCCDSLYTCLAVVGAHRCR